MHALLLSSSTVVDAVDVQKLLTEHNLTVTTAASAQAALRFCESNAPDLMIVDFQAQKDDACDLCRKVRDIPSGSEIALLAIIEDSPAAIEEALCAGVNDYITRPLHAASLAMRVAIVERWLRTRKRNHSPARGPFVAASYADFLALLEASPDPAGIHRDRVFLYANPALRQALGYDSLTGVYLRNILAPEEHEAVEERLRSIERTGEPAPARKERFLRRDGSIEVGEAHSFLVELPDGLAIVTSGRDVTRAESQEAALRHSERLAAVGRLAASVAHEINNPMTLVLFNLWDLSRLVPTLSTRVPESAAGQLEERLQAIEAAVKQMQALTKELTSYARAKEEAPSQLDVSELLTRAVRMISAYAKGVAEASVRVSPAPRAMVLASETRLMQVLLNLLLNAVDAVSKTSPKEQRLVEARVLIDGSDVVVLVEDNGAGIPAAIRERVFDPFFSTKPAGQGTGLGLAVSRSIVAQMGGALTLREPTAEERTTTFELRFPHVQS